MFSVGSKKLSTFDHPESFYFEWILSGAGQDHTSESPPGRHQQEERRAQCGTSKRGGLGLHASSMRLHPLSVRNLLPLCLLDELRRVSTSTSTRL